MDFGRGFDSRRLHQSFYYQLLTSYDSDGFPARVSLIQNLATVSDLLGPDDGASLSRFSKMLMGRAP